MDIPIYFTLYLIGLSTNLIYTDKVEKLTKFKSVYHENKILNTLKEYLMQVPTRTTVLLELNIDLLHPLTVDACHSRMMYHW